MGSPGCYGSALALRARPGLCPGRILRAHGVEQHDDLASGRASPAVLAALTDLRATARAHLDTFDARLHSLPEKSRPAFLAVCLCEPYLRLMEKPGYDPFKTVIELPQWRRQWILWSAASRWGSFSCKRKKAVVRADLLDASFTSPPAARRR